MTDFISASAVFSYKKTNWRHGTSILITKINVLKNTNHVVVVSVVNLFFFNDAGT